MASKKKSAKKKPAAKKAASKSRSEKSPSRGVNKTAFVRGLPTDMSAKDVVAKAKEQGFVLSEAYVYKIRSDEKSAKSKASKGAETAPDAASGTSTGASSAADFVRSLPAGTSAKAAVEQAKAKGIYLTTGYFYTLRSTLGISGGRGSRAPKTTPGKRTPRAAALSLTSTHPTEQAVIDAVSALGIGRVREIVAAVERLQGG